MAFRADEETKDGYDKAMRYLVPNEIPESERERSRDRVADMIEKCGPVIDTYPYWHPLVSANNEDHSPIITPRRECGYHGLDHILYFANGFVTCPYVNGQEVIDSVENLPYNSLVEITAEPLEEKLYHSGAEPIFVRCNWARPLSPDGMIPKSLAVPLLLEMEMRCWREAQLAETWETMQTYFLGTPNGSRSSLFVNQETGQALKKIWNDLIYTGMFGPIRV